MKKNLLFMLLLAILCLVGSMDVKAKTIYFVNTAGWETPYIYAWNDGGNNHAWPGVAMALVEDNVYSADIDGSFTKCIFNNGNGTQTADLTIGENTRYNYSTSWENNGGEIVDTWTIAGSSVLLGSEWNTGDTNNDMTDNGDGTWTLVKEGLELAAGSYEYKALKNHAWGVEVPSSGNKTLTIYEDGVYTITFTLNVSESSLTATATKTGDADIENCYYIKNNWNGGEWEWKKMTQEDAVWTYTGVFGNGGGVNISKTQSGGEWFPTASISGTIAAGDYAKFTYDPSANTVSAEILSTNITIGEYGYATYVTPCALDFTESDVTAYAVTPDLANNKVTLTAQTQVPAGKAIVVKAEQGTHTVPAIASAADFDTALEVSATATAYDSEYTYYYLGVDNGTVGFRPLAEGGEIAAGKCFFKVAKGGSAKFLTFAFDDEATGINNVNASTSSAQAIYNLAGQRVNANAKGIVIKNGRKFINK